MTYNEWLLFIAQIPATPSSVRVRVWRKLRNAGAASLQNGVWILPRNEENTRFFERLLGYARQNEASGQIFVVHALHQAVKDDILLRFENDRNQEYEEFLEQCAAFIAELEKETRKQKFSFAELEENEQNLQRLRKWIDKIQKRDFLNSKKSQEAVSALQNCLHSLHTYARKVYAQEGIETSLETDILPGESQPPKKEANDDIKQNI